MKSACGWTLRCDGPFLRAKHRKKDGGDVAVNIEVTTMVGQSLPDALREMARMVHDANVMRERRRKR